MHALLSSLSPGSLLSLCGRHVGGTTGGPGERVMAVLQDPPKIVPRSPTLVRATLAEVSYLDSEDAGPPVEVRWRVPSQASLAPASCGDVERYYVKCWCRGKGKEVMRTKTSTVDVPRRDFCRNQVNETTVWIKAFGFLSFVVAVAASPKHSVFARKLTRCRSGVVVLLALRHYCSILLYSCLLYTSPSPRDQRGSRMPSSA